MNKVKYISCKWGCQVLRVELNDYENKDFENEIFISIFERNRDKMDMNHRIAHCYHTLIHGKPFGDQIILTKDTAKELSEFINKNIKKREKK